MASTGPITERESNLTYSGESGGLNESDTGTGSYDTQIMWDDTNAAAPEASGPMKESMETMKKAWKDASYTPEGALEVDHAVMMLSFQYDLG